MISQMSVKSDVQTDLRPVYGSISFAPGEDTKNVKINIMFVKLLEFFLYLYSLDFIVMAESQNYKTCTVLCC